MNINTHLEKLRVLLIKTENKKEQRALNKLIVLFEDLEQKNLTLIQEHQSVAVLKNYEKLYTQTLDKKLLRAFRADLLKSLKKDFSLIPKNYYMTLCMSLGMLFFGLPFGFIFSITLDNFAFIGIGLPIGLSIGLAIGMTMDEKAKKEGRQLNVEETELEL